MSQRTLSTQNESSVNIQQPPQSQKSSKQPVSFFQQNLWIPLSKHFLKRKHVPFEKPESTKKFEDKLPTSSNQVLLSIEEKKIQSLNYIKKSFTYYVPTYVRLIIKNFTNIDLAKLQAEANVSIIITFVYGNKDLLKLPQEIAARLYNQVVLNFQRDQSLRLTPQNDNISVKEKQENSQITFTVRRKVHMRILPDIHYTPFEKLYLILPITIQQVPAKTMCNPPVKRTINEKDPFKYEATIKFNFMDRPETKLITIDCKTQTDFGYYSLIENSLEAQYSNKPIKSRRQKEIDGESLLENKLKKGNFQYVSFQATIYKRPMASLLMIFLPLWGLSMINLIIYFQSPQLSSRIASLATLMVAFIALDDNIRSQIPPHPIILFIEYLVYAEITSSLICLVHSFTLRDQPTNEKHKFWWSQIITLGLSFAFLLIQAFLVIGRTLYHYNVQVPNFKLDESEKEWEKWDEKKKSFEHLYWTNTDCDKVFNEIIQKKNPTNLRLYNNTQWIRKLQDVNEEIKKRSVNFTFTYVKPSDSMTRERESIDMILNRSL